MNIKSYTRSDLSDVLPFLNQVPVKPYQGYARWDERKLEALIAYRIKNDLNAEGSNFWLAKDHGRLVGLGSLLPSSWDSSQLGIPVTRLGHLLALGNFARQVDIKTRLLDEIIAQGRRLGVRMLTARLSAADLPGVHVLEEAGFLTMDNLLTFAILTSRLEPPAKSQEFLVRHAKDYDLEAAAEIAEESFSYDRFHSDPAISDRLASKLHVDWLANSIAGKVADAVLVAQDRDGIMGFVTCKMQHDTGVYLGRLIGSIVLVATASRARRKGVASVLTMAAVNWFRVNGADIVVVGTQLRNLPACRLYQNCGFKIVDASVSLRMLL